MRLKRSNDEPLLLTSSASITPPGQCGYRAHYSSLNLFPDILHHLSPSSPVPVWDIPPFGRQLILPPSTPAAAVVVSLAIGITFGVGRIERRFDVWQAAAARRGGDEENNPYAADADSVMLLDTNDYGTKSHKCHFISYSPGQHWYRVCSNHFFTSGNDNLDTTPTLQPPHLDVLCAPHFCYLQIAPSTQEAVRRSRDGSWMWKLTEKGQIFERKIEAEKARLEKIQEAAARRGGEGDKNQFVALCNSRMFDAQMDYLQRNINSLCGATLLSIRSDVRQNPYADGYDMFIPPATHWEAEMRTDAMEWHWVMEKELGDLKRMGVYEDIDALPEGKKEIGC